MGPLIDGDMRAIVDASALLAKYREPIDRESAREILAARLDAATAKRDESERALEQAKIDAEYAKQQAAIDKAHADAEKKVEEAQRRIQDLQQKLGVLDPVSENTVAMQQIATLETELTKKQLELGQLQANARPNPSRVAGVQGDLERLEKLIAERRAQLTQTLDNKDSLAAVTGELRIAEGDLQTRQQLLATAAAQLEAARIEANKQVRYLSLSVAPVPPDQPTYPKAWQNTLVALLIFAGIYLMLSLTASILREQVSS